MAPKTKCPYCKKNHSITKCADAKVYLQALSKYAARYAAKEGAKELVKALIDNGCSHIPDPDAADIGDYDFS